MVGHMYNYDTVIIHTQPEYMFSLQCAAAEAHNMRWMRRKMRINRMMIEIVQIPHAHTNLKITNKQLNWTWKSIDFRRTYANL